MEKINEKAIDINDMARIFKVLSEPNRLLLLNKIMEGVRCNCELGKSLSMAPNLVSHHISILVDAGMIKAERDQKDARWVFYSPNIDLLNQINEHFNELFKANRLNARMTVCDPQKLV